MSVEIIAEIAQGFEGKPEQALLLLRAAAAAGADACKFQLVYADELATPEYRHYGLFRTLEMGDSVWWDLAAEAQRLNVALYVDVFGLRSLRLAESLKLPAVKLHSTDIANIDFVRQVADSSIPRVILGAGGAYIGEIIRAGAVLGSKDLIVLLGFQGYPTPNEANQLARVPLLARLLDSRGIKATLGFADHSSPETQHRYVIAAAAVGTGATVIEKHLTLASSMKLEDYESALNPDEFAEFCALLRDCAAALGVALGTEDLGMSDAEKLYRDTVRRQVVASRALRAGTLIAPADVVLKRTESQEAFTDLALVYGQTVKRPVDANAPLSPAHVE